MSNYPEIRFKGFTDAWEQRNWRDSVNISTDMVDPRIKLYEDYPHIAPGNIESFSGRVLDNVKKVKDEGLISGKFLFKPNDIIYGKINPQLGKYVYSNSHGLTSADAYVLNGKNGLEQKFLYFILQTTMFYNYSVSVSKRSGMPKINREELNNYCFLAPSDKEQKLIGNLLMKVEQTITLHQRKLDKLVEIKKGLLQKIFPENDETIPNIRFKGFTDAWEQRELGEITAILSGARVHKNEWTISGIPFFRSSDVVSAYKGTINEKVFISENLYNELIKKSGKLEKNDLLITGGGSIGIPYLIKNDRRLYTKDADLLWIKKSDTLNNKFLFYYYLSPRLRKYLKSISHTGTIAHYTIEQIRNTPIVFPNICEQNKISNVLEKLDETITLHQRELDKLKEVKQGFLQKLFL